MTDRTGPQPQGAIDRADAVCVVGAGPAGLATARALKAHAIDFDVIEQHDRVGGIWNIDAPGSPMYEAAHFISSKSLSAFTGFPFGDDTPDYPSHRQIFEYLQSFAQRYGLLSNVVFGTTVVSLQPHPGGGWLVENQRHEVTHYRAVVCCSGAQWTPRMPSLPGTFSGELVHSSSYRDFDLLKGRRVLVVGGGNSACDIAVDAGRVAARAVISMRRGYWFIPKHIFGVPSDVFAANGPHLPKRLEQAVFGFLLRLLYGAPERLGLQRPDHRLFETHPVLNSNLFLALQHGDVTARPGIADVRGAEVGFTDGTAEQFDVIIMATGYVHDAPYAERFLGDGRFADMYLTVVSREFPDLYGLSFTETNSGAYTHFDEEAQLIANHLADQRLRPDVAREFRRLVATDHPDLSGGISFDGSARHLGYVDAHALETYRRKLFRRMKWRLMDEADPASDGAVEDTRLTSTSRVGS